MGVVYLFFSIKCLCLIGVWLHEDYRTNTIKTCFKEIGLHLEVSINYFEFNCEHKWEGLCL